MISLQGDRGGDQGCSVLGVGGEAMLARPDHRARRRPNRDGVPFPVYDRYSWFVLVAVSSPTRLNHARLPCVEFCAGFLPANGWLRHHRRCSESTAVATLQNIKQDSIGFIFNASETNPKVRFFMFQALYMVFYSS